MMVDEQYQQNQMTGPLSVIKPLKQRSKSAITNNMFQQNDHFEERAPVVRAKHESYDFVGPTQFRKKLISKYVEPLQQKTNEKHNPAQPIELNQTSTSKNIMNTTINRNTILSSLHKDQQIEVTKQQRNLERYRDYQQIWDRNSLQIKGEIKKNSPILMDTHVKQLYVHPNQDKLDVINNFIVNYWQMSLRNHDPILERHIKGNRFDKLEKEKLLQLREGRRKIEESIPALPMERLGRLKERELSVSGRNKIRKEVDSSEQGGNTTRYSVPSTGRAAQEQVFKISYEGGKRWMGTQNL